METLSRTKPKARKDHICNWCGQPISKGEVYSRSTCVHDGELYSWKAHEKCNKLYDSLKMCDNDDGDGITGESFRETVKDYLSEWMPRREYDNFDVFGPDLVDKAIEVYTYYKNPMKYCGGCEHMYEGSPEALYWKIYYCKLKNFEHELHELDNGLIAPEEKCPLLGGPTE